VAASPDGSVLVTATSDGDLSVRDPATGERIGGSIVTGIAHNNWMSISDDGAYLLVTTWDDTARLVELATHVQLGNVMEIAVMGSTASHFGGAMRPDGRQIALASEEGVQLWDVGTATWRAAACRLAGRNLTREEWARYLPSAEPYHVTCPQWAAGAGAPPATE
jgi:WD40 repeat protein